MALLKPAILVSALLFTNVFTNAFAGELPVRKTQVSVVHFDTPPQMDGHLREASWQTATILTDFYQTQPGDNIAPTYLTEARLGYDQGFLYIGIRAVSDPGEIRATMTKRDAITNDDYVAIYLDTFHDRRTAYVLMFNPYGIQQDGVLIDGKEPDYSHDVVMQSRGVIQNDGYTIEIALPFRSIKFETGNAKSWGIHVLRKVQSRDEENSWMPLRRNKAGLNKAGNQETRLHFLSQAGQLSGLENIASTRTLDLIPAVTFLEIGKRVPAVQPTPDPVDSGGWLNQTMESDPGFTAKVRLTPGISVDAAVNPEFGEVEADQPQITANQRFPLFFEENRLFFLEGIDLFRTPIQAVHTRTIIDPDVAIKLSGKRGRTSFGLLFSTDNAPGNFSEEERNNPELFPEIQGLIDKNAFAGVLRMKRDVGSESSLGILATTYNFVDTQNHIGGLDGSLSITPNTTFDFQILGTSARRFFYDPEADQAIDRTGYGFAYSTQLSKTSPHLSVQLAGEGYTPDYIADLGFTQRVDMNRWSVFTRYNSEPRTNSAFISWSVLFTSLAQFDWKGRMQYAYYYPRVLLNFRRQTYLNGYLYGDYLRIFEEEFGAKRSAVRQGAFANAGERSTVYRGFVIEAGTSPNKKYGFSASVDNAWDVLDYDFGGGPKFPRVSPAALMDSNAPLDPGPGRSLYLTLSTSYQPSNSFRISLNYTKSRLIRNDTQRVAFDQNLYSISANYYFSSFTFLRTRIDYDTMISNVRGQFLLGWTPNPGTALYAGYNDNLNYDGYDPFLYRHEPGLHRNNRTFFIKLSYLFRRGF